MLNIEKYREEIGNQNLKPSLCYVNDEILKNSCTGRSCKECQKIALEFLSSEAKEKIKLTQFEYDLLKCYSENTTDHKFNGINCLKKLKKQGYFKNVDIHMRISEILNNCEVIQDDE